MVIACEGKLVQPALVSSKSQAAAKECIQLSIWAGMTQVQNRDEGVGSKSGHTLLLCMIQHAYMPFDVGSLHVTPTSAQHSCHPWLLFCSTLSSSKMPVQACLCGIRPV